MKSNPNPNPNHSITCSKFVCLSHISVQIFCKLSSANNATVDLWPCYKPDAQMGISIAFGGEDVGPYYIEMGQSERLPLPIEEDFKVCGCRLIFVFVSKGCCWG